MRKPGPPAGHEPDTTQQLAFGLNILANVLQERRARNAEGEILGALVGHGGLASRQLLASRVRIDAEKFDAALDALEAGGLVERSSYEHIADAVRLTDAGRVKMPEVEAEHEAANEEFLAPLSEEERAQFAGLVFKLLAAGRKH